MDTEQQNHKTGNKHPSRSFLYLIVEETHQHAKQICQNAAVARERAQEIRRMSRLARQKSKSAHEVVHW
jgi:hypothetical protein